MTELQTIEISKNNKNKYLKLVLSIVFDLVGMLSYLLPAIGEGIDVFWAPIAGFLLLKMYKGTVGKVAGVIGFLEELIPFMDFIPTFTITWIYTYFFDKKK